ncbi:MAG: mobile mystery protein A [Candidatus Dadabacteria bacterium]|nr:mobile mystery protein A [Candidatus Dadabacteria bacterium]MDE0519199.1 mobile mystery protein A [Candidatus Dadabacteria bacterium]MDE0662601.1 mobile mystery protein A [Candidatus Dadabacteria bacterium]
MSVKPITAKQYRKKLNQATLKFRGFTLPPEGWIRTARKALGMSAAQLARRLGRTRALISNMEKAELNGGVTLRTMRSMAEAVNCRFIYAFVPEENAEVLIKRRAREKAKRHVMETAEHMALEQQILSQSQIEFEIERITENIFKEQPSDLWND